MRRFLHDMSDAGISNDDALGPFDAGSVNYWLAGLGVRTRRAKACPDIDAVSVRQAMDNIENLDMGGTDTAALDDRREPAVSPPLQSDGDVEYREERKADAALTAVLGSDDGQAAMTQRPSASACWSPGAESPAEPQQRHAGHQQRRRHGDQRRESLTPVRASEMPATSTRPARSGLRCVRLRRRRLPRRLRALVCECDASHSA